MNPCIAGFKYWFKFASCWFVKPKLPNNELLPELVLLEVCLDVVDHKELFL
jgi:hypothetical protein